MWELRKQCSSRGWSKITCVVLGMKHLDLNHTCQNIQLFHLYYISFSKMLIETILLSMAAKTTEHCPLQYISTNPASPCVCGTHFQSLSLKFTSSQFTPASDLGLIRWASCARTNSCSLTPDFMVIPWLWNLVAVGTYAVTFAPERALQFSSISLCIRVFVNVSLLLESCSDIEDESIIVTVSKERNNRKQSLELQVFFRVVSHSEILISPIMSSLGRIWVMLWRWVITKR